MPNTFPTEWVNKWIDARGENFTQESQTCHIQGIHTHGSGKLTARGFCQGQAMHAHRQLE